MNNTRWVVLTLAVVAAFACGFVGFQAHFIAMGEARSVLDIAYLTIRLFALEFDISAGTYPWQLEIARFLAPATLAYTAVAAVLALLRDRLQHLRARRFRDHVVICGLGEMGVPMVLAFRQAGHPVIAIELQPDNPQIATCRNAGAVVLFGDATDPVLLRQAQVARATQLFAVCGSDGVNARVAVQARPLVEERRRGVLACFIHIADRQLRELLLEEELSEQRYDALRLEFFSVSERGAHALMSRYPPFAPTTDTQRPEAPHLLVVGLDDLGSSFVLEAARLWLDRGGSRAWRSLALTLVDPEAEEKWVRLQLQAPGVLSSIAPRLVPMDSFSAAFQRADFLARSGMLPPISAAYVCLDDESAAVSTALLLHRRLKDSGVPVVLCIQHETGLAALLAGAGRAGAGGLEVFGLLDRTCRADVLLSGTNELLARVIHEAYAVEQRALGKVPAENPSMREWEEIPATLRDSNRRQADHISTKLKAVGCGARVWRHPDARLFRFKLAEIETLALMEHDRWVQERLADGWRPGDKKDVEQRISPYLGSWSEIPEDVKEYDRNTVRDIPLFLARAGFEVYRLPGSGQSGKEAPGAGP